jgi:nicotinamidase/pyrazinamidase
MTQDWHTPNHISFASAHPGTKPFETIKLAYGDQVLWPDHCVQGTSSADISKDISIPQAQLIVRKGYHKDMDSYSAFFEADHKTPTELGGYLNQRAINKAFVAGLATDFCVAWTAIDARSVGLETHVVEDACRGIDTGGSVRIPLLRNGRRSHVVRHRYHRAESHRRHLMWIAFCAAKTRPISPCRRRPNTRCC